MMTWDEWAAAADAAQAKVDVGLELFNRSRAAKTALAEAVRMPESEGKAWLSQSGVVKQLERIVAAGNANQEYNPEEIDLALIPGRFDLARSLLEISMPPSSQFWTEYRKGIDALLGGKAYGAPADFKVKGILATLLPHITLAGALSTQGDVEGATREVDAAFAKRQKDKRITDNGGVEGDGNSPVLWNLRKAALLSAAGQSSTTT